MMNLTVVASGVFQFKVEGYSFTREDVKSAYKYYQSETFRVGGHDWAVRYYPSKGGTGNFLVALALLREASKPVRVRLAMALLGRSGVPSDATQKVDMKTVPSYCGAPVAVEVLSFVVSHESLAEFLVDDSFVLHCTVSVLRIPESTF